VSEYLLQILLSGLTEGCIYALMGLGLVIIHRSTEVLFFGQGVLAMAGGITMYALYGQNHLPLAISIALAFIVCTAVALVAQWSVILPLLSRGVSPFNVSIITIGIAMIYEMVAMIMFGKDPLPVPSFSGDRPIGILGVSIVPQHIWIVASTALILLVILCFFKKTWLGKALTGLGDNRILALALGFPVARLFTYSFVLAAIVGGLAGIVSAPISYTGYWVGTRLTIKGFVAAAVGGINNPLGAVLGGLMVGLFEVLASGFISSNLKDLIAMVLLLLVLKIRPEGLLGARE